jgi:hypothetical protein
LKKKQTKKNLALSQRAKRATRKKFDAALAQVPNVPPVRGDEL